MILTPIPIVSSTLKISIKTVNLKKITNILIFLNYNCNWVLTSSKRMFICWDREWNTIVCTCMLKLLSWTQVRVFWQQHRASFKWPKVQCDWSWLRPKGRQDCQESKEAGVCVRVLCVSGKSSGTMHTHTQTHTCSRNMTENYLEEILWVS